MHTATATATVAPIIAALIKAEWKLGPNRMWKGISPEAQKFFHEYFSLRGDLELFSEEEIRSWVSDNADELNRILQEEGFSIQLQEFRDDEFGMVSILDVLIEWLVTSKVSELRSAESGNTYAAVSMKQSQDGSDGTTNTMYVAYKSAVHKHPVYVLSTKSGDRLFMTIADEALSGFDLLNRIDVVRKSLPEMANSRAADTLIFPMIDLDQEVDISWLIESSTRDDMGDPWIISQALQQTKFKMNEKGARVKSAVGIATMRYIAFQPRTTYVIDRPFYLWIERSGVAFPVYAGYHAEDVWKNPGDLDTM